MSNKDTYELDVVSVRLVKDRALYSYSPVTTPEKAVNLVANELCDLDREFFCVACLNSKGQPISLNIASIGDINSAAIKTREIFKTAILSNANSVILFHNHPSGDPAPSRTDVDTTARLNEAGELMGIPVADHIIVGSNGKAYSFKANDYIRYDTRPERSESKRTPLEEQIKKAEGARTSNNTSSKAGKSNVIDDRSNRV